MGDKLEFISHSSENYASSEYLLYYIYLFIGGRNELPYKIVKFVKMAVPKKQNKKSINAKL